MNLSSLRSLGVALLFAGALSGTASAELIAAWDLSNAPTNTADSAPPPWDFANHVTVSDFTFHGSTVAGPNSTSPMIWAGWGTTINLNNYVGFTVKANTGYQLNLTDLFYVNTGGIGSNNATSFNWGYRVDGGSWTLKGEVPYDGNADLVTWTFDQPIVTTGTVEIGFFSSATNLSGYTVPTLNLNGNDISLNGTVTPAAVPEPSTIGFAAAGLAALAAIGRSRKAARNS
jgi:hypothetical protein